MVKNYQGKTLAGSGSGFVYKKDDKYGYVMTNYHVVDGSSEIKVLFNDGWALVRASNTGPNITARFEASTQERLEELQKQIFKDGELVYNDPEILEKQTYCDKQMATLYPEVKRIRYPHGYYVDGTEEYMKFKTDLIKKMRNLS